MLIVNAVGAAVMGFMVGLVSWGAGAPEWAFWSLGYQTFVISLLVASFGRAER